MITRRNFIASGAATVSNPLASASSADAEPLQPLKAEPSVRRLHWKEADDGRLVLFTDAPQEPRKLIKEEALERKFGPGTHLVLYQPDHWRMIDEGWFGEEDLYQPTDFDDPAYQIWHANYNPDVEAHDLLYDLFKDRATGPFGGMYIDEFGLDLCEHPCTPRLALAKVNNEECLSKLADAVAALTTWVVVDTSNLSQRHPPLNEEEMKVFSRAMDRLLNKAPSDPKD